MRQVLCKIALILLACAPLFGQQINLQTQVKGILAPVNGGTGFDTSAANGCPKVTNGLWSFTSANCGSGGSAPGGGNFAIQYANGQAVAGANFIGLVKNNGSVQPPTAAAYTDIVQMWNGGTCSGYLKNDGTCSTVATNPAVGTVGTVQVSDGAGHNAAATPSNIGNALGTAYNAPNYIFGDSTSTGSIGCSSYATCWAGLLTNMHGGPTTNFGVNGYSAADAVVTMITRLPILSVQTNSIVPVRSGLIDIGINDATGDCTGTDPNCQANYQAEQNAMIATFETAGSSYFVQAASCTLTGFWSADTTNFVGTQFSPMVSTTSGNSFSCSITTNGNGVALEYVTQSTGAGTASCALDSGTPRTINFFPYTATVHSAYSVFRSAEFAATSGAHTLSCTITSATSASNPVEFIGVDSIPAGQTSTLPPLVVTNVTSIGGTNDAASLAISNLVQPIVTAYQAEGANVFFADIRSVTNIPNYYSASYAPCPTNPASQAALSHGNDCYHRVIANVVQAAAPNVYLPNLGQPLGTATTPYRFQGYPLASSDFGRGFSGGNAMQYFGGSTALSPGAWCIFANDCYAIGSNGSQPIPTLSLNSAVTRINSSVPFCLSSIGVNPITEQSFAGGYRNCWISNGDYFQYMPPSVVSALHVGFLSRENAVSLTGAFTSGLQSDITFVGPLTANSTLNLGGCKSSNSGVRSIEYTIYRHGTDGYSIILQSGAGNGDNINGGSAGNTYVWNATEGDKLTVQCNAAVLGGSSYTISSNQANAGTLSGTTLNPTVVNSSLTSVGPLTKLSTNSITGTGTASFALGAAAQVGTGATTPVCASGYSCNSISGLVQFTTGTGTLAPGVILTVTTGVTRFSFPACSITTSSATYIGANAISTTTTVIVNAAAALAPSTAYNVTYNCGGN